MKPVIFSRNTFRISIVVAVAAFLVFGIITGAGSADKWEIPVGNGRLYDSPGAACQAWVDDVHGTGWQSKAEPVTGNPDVQYCYYFDKNNNNRKELVGPFYRVSGPPQPAPTATPDAFCDETGKAGPYQQFGTSGTKGESFSQTQKKRILDHNEANGGLTSDVPKCAPGQLPTLAKICDPCDTLKRPPTGKPIPGQFPNVDKCRAEVDHIVPENRNGGACGSNAYSNACVISNALNNFLKNKPADKSPCYRSAGQPGAKPPAKTPPLLRP